MTSLYAKLKAVKTCPVCEQDAREVTVKQRWMSVVHYKCGAVFGVSKTLNAIEAFEACPKPSQDAAARLMADTELEGAA